MDRFEAIRTLVAAVDGGSLSAASRSLSVPLPTVSRRVADLEAHLGAQLVTRTSRKLRLTEAGAAYLASARQALEALGEAERAATGEYREPRGELLATAPIAFGVLNVAPCVHAFLAAFPQVSVRLALSDGVIDIVEARLDVAVRIGRLPDSALVARRLGEVQWVTCASPDYLARRGEPATPEALAEHDCIAFEALRSPREWSFAGGDGAVRRLGVRARYAVNTAEAVIAAAVAGLGVARVMSYQAEASVRAGRLVPILTRSAPPPNPVQLVHAPQAQQPLKLRAFLDFVAPRLQERLREIATLFALPRDGATCGPSDDANT